MSELDDYLAVAADVVGGGRRAICARPSGRPQQIEYKGAIDLVTETDRAVETLIIERAARAFPDHLVDRRGGVGRRARRRAPRGGAVGVVSRSARRHHQLRPRPSALRRLARRWRAAASCSWRWSPIRCAARPSPPCAAAARRCNGAPIRVSADAGLDGALLATGTPYDRRERADLYLGIIKRLHAARAGHPPRRLGGARPVLGRLRARRRATGSGAWARGTSPPARSSCARRAAG